MRAWRLLAALVAALCLVITPIVGSQVTAAAQAAQPHGLRGDYYVSAPGTYDQFNDAQGYGGRPQHRLQRP